MINKILVPTDFSEVANNALKYAIGLSIQTNASIEILNVKNIPVMDATFPAEVYSTLIAEIDEIAVNGLAKLVSTFLQPAGVSYKTNHVTGFVNDEIENFTKLNSIDLIVMGTTGASGLKELLIGSNAATIIGKSEVPVLVIPPSADYKEIKHILYASDYTEPEFPALSRLLFFAELNDAQISVLHVKTDFDRFFNVEGSIFNKNKAQFKEEKIAFVTSDKIDISEAIEDFIETHNTNLLVLAKHNRSFFDRLFHRSLSKKMAYHTKIPLLVLHK
jgi:nucleotide-binding universal stress UspA family protein